MSYISKELLAEAQDVEKKAKAGLLEVCEDGRWRPFIRLEDHLLGDQWDRVCIHHGKVAVETIPPRPHEIEYRENGPTEKWRKLLDAYKAAGCHEGTHWIILPWMVKT